DDPLHYPAVAARRGGVQIQLAFRSAGAASSATFADAADAARTRHAAVCGLAGIGRDHRRGDFEFQLFDPVGLFSGEVELVSAAVVARPFGLEDEAADPTFDRSARRDGGRDGAESSERAGALVFYERPGLRPPLPAIAVRALRPESEPHRLDHGVLRVVGIA